MSSDTALIPQLLEEATEHHRAGRLAEAEDLYRRVLELNPQQPDALNLMGRIAEAIGKFDLAAELMTGAAKVRPDIARLHVDLCKPLRRLNRCVEAAASARRAIAIAP